MTDRTGFRLFKWTVYGLLILNTYLFLRTEDTLTAFLDSAAWVVLLFVMEYESTTLDEAYSGALERWAIWLVTAAAYAVILFAWAGYIRERDWIDAINASAWLLVVLVLAWQVFVPGDYDRWEQAVIRVAKPMLYAVLVGCALWWTIDAAKPLDAVDAWLWLVCFAVIELNVFDAEAHPKTAAALPDTAEGSAPPRGDPPA